MELSRREVAILGGVVERYIRSGEPVASRQVARGSGLGLSAATIRSVLAKLEDEGLVSRSHASAGCVPTHRAYRLYVDSLGPRKLTDATRHRLAERISAMRRELVEDIEWVAQVTADLTLEAGMAMRPMGEEPVLEAVSLVPLSRRRVLAVVVTTDGTVEKKVIVRNDEPRVEELQRESSYLNRAFGGMSTEKIMQQLESSDRQLQFGSDPRWLPERTRKTARQLFAEGVDDVEVRVAGADNLLNTDDFAEAERVRSLFATLQDRRRIAREWRRAFNRGKTQVIIGDESDVTASGALGMVATLFYRGGRRAGAVGVVGPQRMDYSRIVPVVEYIGDSLTRMLEEGGATNA